MFTNITRGREQEGFVLFQRLLSMIVARSMLQRLKHVIQNNGGTLDIDILTVVKGNNVHKTGKLSLTSESQNYHLFVEKSVHKLLKHPV